MKALDAIAREVRALRKGLDRMREELRAQTVVAMSRDGAVKRAVASRLMGIGGTKLDQLIKAGKVATAEDSRLVPMSEVRRYCAPKTKRQRRPSVGHRARHPRVDGQSDEAIEETRQRLRAKARA